MSACAVRANDRDRHSRVSESQTRVIHSHILRRFSILTGHQFEGHLPPSKSLTVCTRRNCIFRHPPRLVLPPPLSLLVVSFSAAASRCAVACCLLSMSSVCSLSPYGSHDFVLPHHIHDAFISSGKFFARHVLRVPVILIREIFNF